MNDKGITAPDLSGKLAGPASYFPSIEAKYGHPIQHWLDLVVEELGSGKKHMEAVAQLKDEHAMGHGHANAIVAYARSRM